MSIEIKNISKSFGSHKVLDNINISIPQNAVTCLMAPSGGGKTTLTRILLSLEEPDEGSVTGMPENVSAVFQEDRLCETLSVSKNIRIACPKASSDDISEHLSAVGLNGAENKKAGELSGGQKRRVSIVRALLSDADFTVFDEPFAGLDEETRKNVIKYMKENLKNKTALVVTHDVDDAAALEADVVRL